MNINIEKTRRLHEKVHALEDELRKNPIKINITKEFGLYGIPDEARDIFTDHIKWINPYKIEYSYVHDSSENELTDIPEYIEWPDESCGLAVKINIDYESFTNLINKMLELGNNFTYAVYDFGE